MQGGLATLLVVSTMVAPGCAVDHLCADLFDAALAVPDGPELDRTSTEVSAPSLSLAELLSVGPRLSARTTAADGAVAEPPGPGSSDASSDPAPTQRETPPVTPAATEARPHAPHHPEAPTAIGSPQPHAPQGRGPVAEGAALAGAGAGAAAGLGTALAAIALYHRLTKETVLRHPARRRVLALLEQRPGMGTSDVASALDCSYRTARHHLEKLAHFDLVRCHRLDASIHWTLPGDGEAAPSLDTGHQELLDHIRDHPGLHLSALAQALGVAKSTAKHRLDRLVERGLVREERIGPLRCFQAVEEPPDGTRGGAATGPSSADHA